MAKLSKRYTPLFSQQKLDQPVQTQKFEYNNFEYINWI